MVAGDTWNALAADSVALGQQITTIQLTADADIYAQTLKRPKSTHSAFVQETAELLPTLIDIIASYLYADMDSDTEGVDLPQFDPEELVALEEADLMEILTTLEDRVPREVIDACAARNAAMLPWLRAHLEEPRHWSDAATSAEFWGLLHCVMVLGLMDSPQAAELLLEVFERMVRRPDHELWEWLEDHWATLFSNKGVGTEPFAQVAGDERIAGLPRSEAIACLVAAAYADSPVALEAALDQAATVAADLRAEAALRVRAADVLLSFPRERHRELLLEVARLQIEEPAVEYVAFDEDDVTEAFQAGDTSFWDSDPWSFYEPDEIALRQARVDEAANEEEPW
jgi:hypothetical protein